MSNSEDVMSFTLGLLQQRLSLVLSLKSHNKLLSGDTQSCEVSTPITPILGRFTSLINCMQFSVDDSYYLAKLVTYVDYINSDYLEIIDILKARPVSDPVSTFLVAYLLQLVSLNTPQYTQATKALANEFGEHAFILALESEPPLVKKLLAAGANVTKALLLALEAYPHSVRCLLEFGATVVCDFIDKSTKQSHCICNNESEYLTDFHGGAFCYCRISQHWSETPIFVAATYHPECIEVLLDYGADINARCVLATDNTGATFCGTPLHLLCWRYTHKEEDNFSEHLQVLLDNGAAVNALCSLTGGSNGGKFIGNALCYIGQELINDMTFNANRAVITLVDAGIDVDMIAEVKESHWVSLSSMSTILVSLCSAHFQKTCCSQQTFIEQCPQILWIVAPRATSIDRSQSLAVLARPLTMYDSLKTWRCSDFDSDISFHVTLWKQSIMILLEHGADPNYSPAFEPHYSIISKFVKTLCQNLEIFSTLDGLVDYFYIILIELMRHGGLFHFEDTVIISSLVTLLIKDLMTFSQVLPVLLDCLDFHDHYRLLRKMQQQYDKSSNVWTEHSQQAKELLWSCMAAVLPLKHLARCQIIHSMGGRNHLTLGAIQKISLPKVLRQYISMAYI